MVLGTVLPINFLTLDSLPLKLKHLFHLLSW